MNLADMNYIEILKDLSEKQNKEIIHKDKLIEELKAKINELEKDIDKFSYFIDESIQDNHSLLNCLENAKETITERNKTIKRLENEIEELKLK